jgi:hypothetical protein
MPDVQSGETFVDGQTFNAARANNAVNGATILPAFLSGKAAILHGAVVPANDLVLIYQASSSLLKKITIAEFNQIAGSVSSVGLTMPSGFSVSGSPVTSAGTLGVTLASQSGNKHLASPASGSGAPTFRARDPRDSRYGTSTIAADSIDWVLADSFTKTLSANTTFTFANSAAGAQIVVIIHGSGFTYTWPAAVKWAGGTEQHPDGVNLFRFTNVNGTIYGNLEIENAS